MADALKVPAHVQPFVDVLGADLTERLKGDAEKVVALQQDFVSKSQKLAEENVKQATDTATKATANAK